MKLQLPAGVRLGTADGRIAKRRSDDVLVIAFDRPVPVTGVFTTNRFAAPPVQLAKKHLQATANNCMGWVINAGNANCGTGELGIKVASKSCEQLATALGCTPEHVLPFSTGVIMEQLDLTKLLPAIDTAVTNLATDHWNQAAIAIMTTDTKVKLASIKVGDHQITGIAKGSGMIHPQMATMLAFMVTDATVTAEQLQQVLQQANKTSFNSISVDGDSSTNDAAMLAATGDGTPLTGDELVAFATAVGEICQDLAMQILRDGEGCSKTASVKVENFASEDACKLVAESIACSPLIKTMLAASDPNLGRLLMAIGKAGAEFDPNKIKLSIAGQLAFSDGIRCPKYSEELAVTAFTKDHIRIEVDGGGSNGQYTCNFTDLTEQYVKINAEYRT